MNLAETTQLLFRIRAACPGMTIVEGMPQTWQEILADVDADDAATAVMGMLRESREIPAPADVRRGAATVRRERVKAQRTAPDPFAIPDADPDDVPAYLAALRAGRWKDQTELPQRDVNALTAGAFRDVPEAS